MRTANFTDGYCDTCGESRGDHAEERCIATCPIQLASAHNFEIDLFGKCVCGDTEKVGY